MLWARRVHGSARRLSCTLEWSERSARDQPKLRMIEARALVALSMAREQRPADAIPFSAFLAVEPTGRPADSLEKSAIYHSPMQLGWVLNHDPPPRDSLGP